jgi:GNAT superfamily N-acetyltransferase
MDLRIRAVERDDVEDLVHLSLLAWAPVFPSFEQILSPEIYARIWPDWRAGQKEAVETVCREPEKTTVWVAEADGRVVGFIAYELNAKDKTGTVVLLAVHPDYQNRGIGTKLNIFALDKMKESGVKLAIVETGGRSLAHAGPQILRKGGLYGLAAGPVFQRLVGSLDFEQNFECDQKPGFLHLCAILCSLKPVDSGRFLGQGKQKPGFLSVVQSPRQCSEPENPDLAWSPRRAREPGRRS